MHQTKTVFCALAAAMVLVLSGCKNDRDGMTYDDIGEQRVFDTPRPKVAERHSQYINESVPAPAPLTPSMRNAEAHASARQTPRRANVGELIPE